MTERPSCLEHIVFVHSCIKSFVDQVKHLKEVKRGAGPGKVVEAVNLQEEDQIQKVIDTEVVQIQKVIQMQMQLTCNIPQRIELLPTQTFLK